MTNTSILAAFERMWRHVAIALGGKSDLNHTHDEYVSSIALDALESEVNTSISNITNGTTVVAKSEEANHATSSDTATNATHAISADTATTATSATQATQDGDGNVISSTYETKADANSKLEEAKAYSDTVVSGKADSEHSHDDKYYTESEIDSKISTLNTAINDKASSTHTHEISEVANLQSSLDEKVPMARKVNGKALSSDITLDASDVSAYSKTEIDDMTFITKADIATICDSTISVANLSNEVRF